MTAVAATAVLVAAFGLMLAAIWAAFVSPPARYAKAWIRVWTLAVSFGLFDSHRQAERASHVTGGHRTAPPERGSVWPSLRTLDGLPVRYRVIGRVNQHGRDHHGFTAEVEHYTGRPWTLHRRPGRRTMDLRQAPAWPEIPAHPEPMVLAPWVLPVGDTVLGPALWDVTSAYHRLTIARTGWRKTSHAAWLADYLHGMRHWTVIKIDPEHASPADQLAKLRRLDAELEARPADVAPLHRFLVQIDEFDDVMEPTTRADDDHEVRRQARALVRKILRHGGKRGFHVDAYAQDPRAKALGPGIRSKFAARAAGWLDLAEISLVLNRTVAHDRDGPPGRGWWSVPGAKPTEAQFHTRPTQHEANPHAVDKDAPTTRVTRIFGAISDRPRRQYP